MWNLDVFWGRTEARSEGWDRAHNAPSNLLTLLEYRRVTFSFFFFLWFWFNCSSFIFIAEFHCIWSYFENTAFSQRAQSNSHSNKQPSMEPICCQPTRLNSAAEWSPERLSQLFTNIAPARAGLNAPVHMHCTQLKSFIFLKHLGRFKTPAAQRIESTKNINGKMSKKCLTVIKSKRMIK